MCGRFGASRPPDLTASLFDAALVDEPPPPSWNVAPTDPVSCVVQRPHGARELRTLRWGLVPAWADPKDAAKRINARAETVATKPSFRVALRSRRLLVPADGWYEWPGKVPHFITRDEPIAFAGLYEVVGDLRTFTIVTTRAADDVAHLHERMPVVLPRDAWELWLDTSFEDPAALLVPQPGCRAYPVSTAVNSVRNNGPALAEPV